MVNTPESVATFLRGRRIAVAGVSRHPGEAANAVFRKLKGSGYEVFPINPGSARTTVSAACGSIAPSGTGAFQRRPYESAARTASRASSGAARSCSAIRSISDTSA
jgi:hypothetical protein